MNSAKQTKGSLFWFASGPILLFATLVLLFFKTARLSIHPVWLFGLGLSAAIASGIILLALLERTAHEKRIQAEIEGKEKQIEGMRGVLDETNTLFRRKVDHLENECQKSLSEMEEKLSEKEKDLKENIANCETLLSQTKHHKSQANSFQNSLEEALSELRQVRQSQFLTEENGKNIPLDVVNKYKQLRQQFDEKQDRLNATREELFALQTDYFALQKEQDLQVLEENPLFARLAHLSQANEALENEIEALEKITTAFITKKKAARTKKAEKLDEMLLQFDP